MAYGIKQYGVLPFGATASDTDVPVDPNIPDLMAYLPEYYSEIRDMRSIQDANAQEIGLIRYDMENVLAQFFVDSATWGLEIWERERGLITDPSKSYAWRREIITAKNRGAGTTTKTLLKNAAASFSGGEVDIIEYPAEYRFVVQFIGVLGIPPNMAGFQEMLDRIKPAHLSYSFKYTYTWWDSLKSLTWAQAGANTWNGLKTYKEA